jgi:hypothetical protein
VGNLVAHKILSLASIGLLQRRKTTNIKRLQKVRRVRMHTKGNNLIILTVLLESKRVVALITINNEQAVAANNLPLRIRVKVLQPRQTKLIYYPAILRD